MREKIAIGQAIIIVTLLVLNALCLSGVFSNTKKNNGGSSSKPKLLSKGGRNKRTSASSSLPPAPTSCPQVSKKVVHSQSNCLNPGVFNGNRDPDPAMFPCNIKINPWTI